MSDQETLAAPTRQHLGWARAYSRQLLALDIAAVVSAMSLALLLGVGTDLGERVAGTPSDGLPYVVLATALGALWVGALLLHRCQQPEIIGSGSDEFRRIGVASLRLWGLVAIACYVADISLARRFVALALPLGLALMFLAHWVSRRWLRKVRARTGGWSHRVLILGDRDHVEDLVARVQRTPESGYHVVGLCLPGGPPSEDILGVPVVGSLTTVVQAVEGSGADTVAVTTMSHVTAPMLRRLSWHMEQMNVSMIVAPSLTDVAGPRIHVRQVDGLPLLHIAQPEFTGPRRLIKETFDRSAAGALLILMAPALLAVGLTIRLTSPGPAIFRQRRIGKGGEPFTCYKLRTMVPGAERQLDELAIDGESRILFKIDDDPRVTRVGKLLRRFSVDEVPQLFNVVKGDMSLVGPRPQVQAEVDQYTPDYSRRLLVKPGITGLWQVSGRSDLTYEESERLDLYYVENWSLANDLMILWRTLRAVVAGGGAY